ncbi:nucleotide exchange factor GrpE (plasmid) [Embleya sp. NBC_00888]|uniref:nucleotide exchange factor GrpE n=1 Tax=Embleya sp. NBC_00888 TaxID=2975960 RepID=UPI002F91A3FF|nr:nucleotide exchange factor GrpE [Embleya sp. NBC_00888]
MNRTSPGPGLLPVPAGHPQSPVLATLVTEIAALRGQLTERVDEMRRLQADYDAYRAHVRRDRLAMREAALANVLTPLLPVVDGFDRARAADELTSGVARVVGQLEDALAALGLRGFGAVGDTFDPHVHDALAHRPCRGADPPICSVVHTPGYRVGERLLRPARVTVTGPGPGPGPGPTADSRGEAGAAHEHG